MPDQAPRQLWTPSPDAWEQSRVGQFLREIERKHRVSFADYESGWQWSWIIFPSLGSGVAFVDLQMTPATQVLTPKPCPGEMVAPLTSLCTPRSGGKHEAVALTPGPSPFEGHVL